MLYQVVVMLTFILFTLVGNGYASECQGKEMTNGFCWPVEGDDLLLMWRGVNDNFPGKFHLAQDIRANEGDDVYAIADVVEVLHKRMDVDCYGGLNSQDHCIDGGGLIIKYQLANGQYFTALYAHVKNISVSSETKKGQKIAEIGPYRNGTVHLHFGIRFPFDDDDNRWAGYGTTELGFVDPINFLNTHYPYIDFSDDSIVKEIKARIILATTSGIHRMQIALTLSVGLSYKMEEIKIKIQQKI